jgi:hypothetical protein
VSRSLWLVVLLVGACVCLASGICLLAQTTPGQAKISASAIEIEPVESKEAALPPEFAWPSTRTSSMK